MLFADEPVIHDATRVADEQAALVMKRNGDASLMIAF